MEPVCPKATVAWKMARNTEISRLRLNARLFIIKVSTEVSLFPSPGSPCFRFHRSAEPGLKDLITPFLFLRSQVPGLLDIGSRALRAISRFPSARCSSFSNGSVGLFPELFREMFKKQPFFGSRQPLPFLFKILLNLRLRLQRVLPIKGQFLWSYSLQRKHPRCGREVLILPEPQKGKDFFSGLRDLRRQGKTSDR